MLCVYHMPKTILRAYNIIYINIYNKYYYIYYDIYVINPFNF